MLRCFSVRYTTGASANRTNGTTPSLSISANRLSLSVSVAAHSADPTPHAATAYIAMCTGRNSNGRSRRSRHTATSAAAMPTARNSRSSGIGTPIWPQLPENTDRQIPTVIGYAGSSVRARYRPASATIAPKPAMYATPMSPKSSTGRPAGAC
jgi:hypothetical protein